MAHHIISFFFFLLLLSSNSFGQSALTRSVDSLIKISTPRSFNGIIKISQNGNTIYERAYGLSDAEKMVSLRMEDKFIIGSISKQITAVLVLQEVQAGRIKLKNTIHSYLPEFSERWADSVTIQQLLNHTSGIRNWNTPLLFEPGRQFSYSNLNYAILGKVVEKTSSQTYANLTRALFSACKMVDSKVPASTPQDKKHQKIVRGYVENHDKEWTSGDNILTLLNLPVMGVPAAGIISNVEDLTRWNYCLHERKILTDSIYRSMINEAVIRPHRWGEVKYGDGVQIDYIDGIQELSMSGYVPGFISTILYFPSTKISVVILENRSADPTDMTRVYYFHDQIRKLVKKNLVKQSAD
ncbi:beta-lactamase family protein [Dyadobacter chenwenxiniae]|uniref:Beta-lactamase family protein n=1 Tax=Dyadobacter chenwenxiniae TaxID=2906456 RepID=A0A9X1PSQ2_9BACT|nr:serine hydrolase domain-containing protein [Dyadobacter chenwenxiniae]MCF0065795.1 beta-lactamase family protein [Dyadobacter chenwenxiniae]UON84049.1 beta-lactamase family protein [Dyadobacter chenwenxiniae]